MYQRTASAQLITVLRFQFPQGRLRQKEDEDHQLIYHNIPVFIIFLLTGPIAENRPLLQVRSFTALQTAKPRATYLRDSTGSRTRSFAVKPKSYRRTEWSRSPTGNSDHSS